MMQIIKGKTCERERIIKKIVVRKNDPSLHTGGRQLEKTKKLMIIGEI